jgi:hypothetical protein
LHTHSSPLDEWYVNGPFLNAVPHLALAYPSPPLSYSTDDPDIPKALHADLMASGDAVGSYIENSFGTRPFASAWSASRGSMRALTTDGPREAPVKGMSAVVQESARLHDRVIRLLAGYFGGASLFASDFPSLNPDAALPHVAPVSSLLGQLDAQHDAAYRSSGLRAVLRLPPFLSVVLERARSRDDIPRECSNLKAELEGEASIVHTALRRFNEARTPKDAEGAYKMLHGVCDQLGKRQKANATPLMLRLRGIGLDVLSFLLGGHPKPATDGHLKTGHQ